MATDLLITAKHQLTRFSRGRGKFGFVLHAPFRGVLEDTMEPTHAGYTEFTDDEFDAIVDAYLEAKMYDATRLK